MKYVLPGIGLITKYRMEEPNLAIHIPYMAIKGPNIAMNSPCHGFSQDVIIIDE